MRYIFSSLVSNPPLSNNFSLSPQTLDVSLWPLLVVLHDASCLRVWLSYPMERITESRRRTILPCTRIY